MMISLKKTTLKQNENVMKKTFQKFFQNNTFQKKAISPITMEIERRHCKDSSLSLRRKNLWTTKVKKFQPGGENKCDISMKNL